MTPEEDITVLDVAAIKPGSFQALTVYRLDDNIYESRVIPVSQDGAFLQVEEAVIELDIWLTTFVRSVDNRYIFGSDEGALFHVSVDGIEVEKLFEDAVTRIIPANKQGLIACSLDGEVARLDGFNKSVLLQREEIRLLSVAVSNRGHIATCGEEGVLLYWSGGSWQTIDLPTNLRLSAVEFIDESLFVGGDNGVCWCVDADLSIREIAGFSSSIYGFTKYGKLVACAASADGVVVIDDNEVRPLTVDLQAYGIALNGDRLIAYGGQTVSEFDGEIWRSVDLVY